MKKILPKGFILVFLCLALATGNTFAQFYDGFVGTGNIGGDCADATCNSNGWFTHSNSKTGTDNILTDGSLSYSGLAASTGNRILLPASNSTVPRDINAAITITGNIAYYSFLIKVVDATQLSSTAFDYFMHLAPSAGNTFTAFTYTGRLGAKSVNAGANYHLGIQNIGTSYTEYTTDLAFGTTYLVVVKVDLSTTPNITASLWVNPFSLGGAEPTSGMVTNSAGTGTSTFGAICLRNGSTTPKTEIDEIRVSTTWAQVTPLPLLAVSALTQNAANDAAKTVNVQSSIPSGKVYIVLDGVNPTTTADLDAAILAKKAAFAVVTSANTDVPVSTSDLVGGTYHAYAVDVANTISTKGTNAITITDVTVPVVSASVQSAYNIAGQTVNVQSSNADGAVYIILNGITISSLADFNTAIAANKGAKAMVSLPNTNIQVSTNALIPGSYYAYAVDGANNISTKGVNIITISAPAISVTALSQNVTNFTGQSVNIQSSASTGNVYLIKSALTITSIDDLTNAVTAKNGATASVTAASTDMPVSTTGLNCGSYSAYAINQYNNISPKGGNIIIVSPVVIASSQSASNYTDQTVKVQSSSTDGAVYIILNEIAQATLTNLDDAVKANKGAKYTVSNSNTDISISTANLIPGNYYAYSVDAEGDLSVKGSNVITITDGIAPIVKANAQNVSSAATQVVLAQSNKLGFIYLILSSVAQSSLANFDAAVAAGKAVKLAVTSVNKDVQIPAYGLSSGTYAVYAVDLSGNISVKNTNMVNIIGLTGIDESQNTNNVNIYSNNDKIIIDLNIKTSDKAFAEVFNLRGRKLASFLLTDGVNTYTTDSERIQIVKVSIGNKVIVKKVVLQ